MVARTRSRPIPSGQVSVRDAIVFLVVQALIGLLVLMQFNRFTILVGIASLGIVAIYPLMKRITWWPQIVLGLAFSYGALMGWAAVFSRLEAPAFLLYAGSICWVIGYDTIYAHQDREDDALIGVKSTARLFATRTRLALIIFYSLAVLLIGLAGAAADAGPVLVVGCILFGAHLGWQIEQLDIDDPELCLRLFKSNRDAGLILFAALIGDALYKSYFF
jgi:4-hydroxybenzoate polyprenyltransferase